MDAELKKVRIETNENHVDGYYPSKWDYRFMKLADLEVAQWS
jgi:hypothetical protein